MATTSAPTSPTPAPRRSVGGLDTESPKNPILTRRLPTRWVPWLLGALATVTASLGSWIPSLWGDEATSVMSATRSLPSLFGMLRHVDAVHGSYYFGLHWWVLVFGSSPFSVRTPSAIAVGFATVGVVLLVRRLADPSTAIVAGVVCILLPRLTYAGEEARSYAFTAAIAAWLLVLLVDLMAGRRSGWQWWALFGAVLCYSVTTFLYLGLFVVVHAAVLASCRVSRSTWRRWAIASGAGLVAASPIVVTSAFERSQIAFLAGQTTTDARSLLVGLWFSTPLYAIVAWVLIVVAVGAWILRSRSGRSWRSSTAGLSAAGSTAQPSLELVGLAWLVLPGGLLLLSNLVVPDFTGRYLSMSAPGAAVLIAAAIRALARLVPAAPRAVGLGTPRRRLVTMAALTALVLVVAVPGYLAQRTPYAKNGSDWAEISDVVGEHASPGAAVVFDESTRPSRRPRLALHTYPQGFRGLSDVTLEVPFTASETWHDDVYTVPAALALGRFRGYTHVWVIEYADGGVTDSYGLDVLQKAGYQVTATYRTHRSEILELVR